MSEGHKNSVCDLPGERVWSGSAQHVVRRTKLVQKRIRPFEIAFFG